MLHLKGKVESWKKIYFLQELLKIVKFKKTKASGFTTLYIKGSKIDDTALKYTTDL